MKRWDMCIKKITLLAEWRIDWSRERQGRKAYRKPIAVTQVRNLWIQGSMICSCPRQARVTGKGRVFG